VLEICVPEPLLSPGIARVEGRATSRRTCVAAGVYNKIYTVVLLRFSKPNRTLAAFIVCLRRRGED
jgi:hypothetical protein